MLVCGRCYWTFNVVGDFNLEALTVEIDFNIPAQRVEPDSGQERGKPWLSAEDANG